MRAKPAVLLADLLLMVWVAGWIFVAVRVGLDVRTLGQLPRQLHAAGHAIVTTGGAIGTLGHLPFIGRGLGRLGSSVAATGSHAEAAAVSAGSSVDQLSVLLPIVVCRGY